MTRTKTRTNDGVRRQDREIVIDLLCYDGKGFDGWVDRIGLEPFCRNLGEGERRVRCGSARSGSLVGHCVFLTTV